MNKINKKLVLFIRSCGLAFLMAIIEDEFNGLTIAKIFGYKTRFVY